MAENFYFNKHKKKPVSKSLFNSNKLSGLIDSIKFANEETGFAVILLILEDIGDKITAVGQLTGIQVGAMVELNGEWQNSKFGEQFKVNSFNLIIPSSIIGITKYLSSGMIDGIGNVMAGRLVAAFKENTLEVIENESERLTEVEGIGKVRAERIVKAFIEHKNIHKVMIFLQEHGVSPAYAAKIFKKFGQNTIKFVSENPYRLASEIFGIGFKSADKIAINLGISTHSEKRAEAGIIYALTSLSDDGHVYYPEPDLITESVKLLNIPENICSNALNLLLESFKVIKEFNKIGLPALVNAEKMTASSLAHLVKSKTKPLKIDLKKAINQVYKQTKIHLDKQQEQAVSASLNNKVIVITGGPGTGKTTIVNSIIKIFKSLDKTVTLCAPTGRAAKRLEETSGIKAKTIHRLLEYSPRKNCFLRDRNKPLFCDLLVTDESSMLDITLISSLLQAIPQNARLILVGDVDQLPSVGPGSVLLDIIKSNKIKVVTLKTIHRQAQRSQIVTNAHLVNSGHMPITLKQPAQIDNKGIKKEDNSILSDFYFIEKNEPEEIIDVIKRMITERIPKRFGVDPVFDIQVLTPMNRGLLGTFNLNNELQSVLNKNGEEFIKGGKILKSGDKVMQIKNNYDYDVFNGDIGLIKEFDNTEKELTVNFDGRLVTYDYSETGELTLSYACSIHKSQGSEYPVVIIPIHSQHYIMLQRNLLYTALTRAKKLVVLVGTKKAVYLSVNQNKANKRYTALTDRLKQLI